MPSNTSAARLVVVDFSDGAGKVRIPHDAYAAYFKRSWVLRSGGVFKGVSTAHSRNPRHHPISYSIAEEFVFDEGVAHAFRTDRYAICRCRCCCCCCCCYCC
jgi:hypothetical protein